MPACFQLPDRWRQRPAPTMASADSCPITATVASGRATLVGWHAGQVSPDKNVNCRYTTAAFTTSPESMGLRHVVLTCPDDGLVCCFCSSAHSFALRLPPDPSSRRRPCLRLVLVLRCLTTGLDSPYRGLAPHKFTPMPGVHLALHLIPLRSTSECRSRYASFECFNHSRHRY